METCLRYDHACTWFPLPSRPSPATGTPLTLRQKLSEANGVESMLFLRNKAEEVCQSLDIRNPLRNGSHLDNMSFEDWVRSVTGPSESALASASIWTRAMLGMEPREVSALFFLNYCKSGGGLLQMRSDQKNGGQYLRLAKGSFHLLGY